MKVIYIRKSDSLIILWAENKPAISRDIEGEFLLRVAPETNEIIGIEIEDFSLFLKKHNIQSANP